MEQESVYDEVVWEGWKESPVTRRLLKANQERVKGLTRYLEGAAIRSPDPEVREAMARLQAARVIVAELLGQDEVGGGQQ